MYNIQGKKILFKIIKENSLPFKVNAFFISESSNLLSSMSEINSIIELNNPDLISFLYSAKEEVHIILYNNEETIDIKFDIKRMQLSYLFFLSLLIKDKPEIINYTFQLNFIKEINKDIQKIDEINQIKIILKCKIIIELINNFKGIDRDDEDADADADIEIADKIEIENKNIIENNIIALKNLNLFYNVDDIIEKPIDKLYIDIIISLIKQKKFEDYDYTTSILNQMEIEKICITETMLKELCNLFNSNEDYIIDYSFTKNEDLFDEKKINFFYILLKYVFKTSFYIYQIDFLYQQKKFILGELLNISKKKIDNRLEYILKMMLDSDYYFEDKLEQLQEVLIYYKSFLFESKEKDIAIIEDVIKYNKMGYHKYLKNYDIAKKMNKRKDIINYLFDLNNNNNESDIEKFVEKWNTIEYMINKNIIEEIDKKIIGSLINYFKDPMKQNELKNIFTYDAINYFKNNAIPIEIKSTNITTNLGVDNKKENIEENLDAGKTKTGKDDLMSHILSKLEIFLHTYKKEKKTYFFYDKISYGENLKEINFKNFFNIKSEYKEKHKNKQFDNKKERILVNNIMKLYDFLEEFENKITKLFQYSYNLILKLDIFKEKNNDNSNPEIENITCIYIFFEPIKNEPISFRDINILLYGTNSSTQGFEFLIFEINNESYRDIKYKEFNFKDEQSKLKDNKKGILDVEFSSKMNKIFENIKLDEISDKDMIIKFIKIIGKHPNTADFVMELKNGYYISGGFNKEIILYDRKYNKIVIVDDFKDWVYSIFGEKITENNIEFNTCTYKDLTLINIDLQSLSSRAVKVFEIPNRTNIYCIEMTENNFIILGQGGAIYYIDLFNENKVDKYKITEKTYSSGSKINDTIACLVSNKLLIEGEDKLIFFNTKINEISDKNTIEGFSFNISINCLYLVKSESNSSKDILLCACKKYQGNQENGILLVEIGSEQSEGYKYKFYKTNFEVYCFCSISNIKNNNDDNDEIKIDEEYRKNINIERTVYCFIGGFDVDKRQGTIKLYKLLYNSEETQIKYTSDETQIEYIQDIDIDDENFEYFNGAISCIIQSSITGNILVSCENGYVYLFSHPNIEYYLENDREEIS